MKPIRVQLSRRKGWTMPPNTVKVDRSTRWGNPFDVRKYGIDRSLRLYESLFTGWRPSNVAGLPDNIAMLIYRAHCDWRRRLNERPRDWAHAELRGKNLACWCGLDADACHASVLLRIANAGDKTE